MDKSKEFFRTRIDGITFAGHIWKDGPYIERVSSNSGFVAPIGPWIWIERDCTSKEKPPKREWFVMLGKNKRIPLSGLSDDGIDRLSAKFALPIKNVYVNPDTLKRFWWDRFWTTDVFDGLCEWVSCHKGGVRKIALEAQKSGSVDLPWWLYYTRWENGPVNKRVSIAQEGITSEELRKRMVRDKSRAVRVAVAQATREDTILSVLSLDKSALVRCAVAGNRSVSIGLLSVVLSQDKNAAVREQAKATLQLACKR
ncbi:MAG: hypothetical protein WCF54_20975 [Terracidiphilus sp.]